jgi:hypothetical protein
MPQKQEQNQKQKPRPKPKPSVFSAMAAQATILRAAP